MQIGDKVHVSGTVRDIKENSVLIVCADDREYWCLEKNVEADVAAPEVQPVEPTHALPEAPARPGHELPAEPEPPTPTPHTTIRRR